MTPVIVVLFILALCSSYVFLAMNTNTLNYAGDYKFVLFKTMMVVSIIAIGYLSTLFSVCYAYLPVVGPKVAAGLKTIFEQDGDDGQPSNTLLRTFLEYLSAVWFIFAVALLPFGHTVFRTESQQIDVDRTNQLRMIYQTIYAAPYYFMMLIFSVHMFLFFFTLGSQNHQLPGNEQEDQGRPGVLKDMRTFSKKITPTCGCFFYIKEYDVESKWCE